MDRGWVRAAGGCAVLALLAGCGGGSSGTTSPVRGAGTISPTNESEVEVEAETESRVRTGVFVDSPVEGLAYATETRSGVTDGDGRFDYLPGESVTFSIGELVFPTVDAAERLTPIDLGREASDVERFAVNVARLLQTLDMDGDPDNGIVIPSAARQFAAVTAFDVEADVFENDPAVIDLVLNVGTRGDGLISEAAAMEHFGVALGAASVADATAGIAGFWSVEDGSWSADREFRSEDADMTVSTVAYAAISTDGALSLYRYAFDPYSVASLDCYAVEHRTLTPLSGDDYLAADAPGGGNLSRMALSRPSVDRLVATQSGSEREAGWTIAMTPVTGQTPADLPLCTGESFQVPPVETTSPSAELAGLWAVEDVDEREADDRAISYLRIDEYGDGRLYVATAEFGLAPDFELRECHARIGDVYLDGTSDEETFRGHAYTEETVTDVYGANGEDSYEYVDYVDHPVTLTRDGDMLVFDFGDEGERRLSAASIDTAALSVCGEANVSPLDAVEGLWRERGDGLFGDYVHIDPRGVMGGVAPEPGGDACYLDVPSVTLTPIGGLDFTSVDDDGGGEETTLRMTLDGTSLTVGEIAPDGAAAPVRWLERVRGLFVDDFERCETPPEKEAIADLEPLAGRWSRVVREELTDWGPDGSESLYRQYEYVDISAAGKLERVYASVGEYYSYSREDLCKESWWYGSSFVAFEVIGDDLFRVDGDLTTIVRDGDTLVMTDSRGTTHVFERSDTALEQLPSCDSGLTDVDPLLGPLDGLWTLESPTDDDASFTVLRFDTGRRENYEHFLYHFDADADCHVVEPLSLETASEDRIVIGRQYRDGSAVGTFDIVDGELDIALRSAADALPGLRDGRYPRLLGLDVGRLLHGYDSDRYLSACPTDWTN